LVAFRHRDSAGRHGLFGCQENVVQPAVTVGVGVVGVELLVVLLLVAAPEAAAVAAETGSSFAPFGIAPIQDSDLKELHLPCQQI
jgi:hypothetical protein